MTKVKICGITNLEDAQLALKYGADSLGFNFFRGSPRYISPSEARAIVDALPTSSSNVGVFVDEPVEEVLNIAETVGLDGLQLHGDENMNYIAALRGGTRCFVVKAFRVSSSDSVISALEWDIDHPLFDSHSTQARGGTGIPFDWERFGAEISHSFPGTAYLAGGLNAENVAEAIRMVGPYAVDAASGVESSPGKKDPKKMAAFIERAKIA